MQLKEEDKQSSEEEVDSDESEVNVVAEYDGEFEKFLFLWRSVS